MNPHTQLIVAVAGLSVVISYAWWVRFRVWILRQDLFAIRDELWDRMHELGLLHHPDHVRTRTELNAMIWGGPYLSFFVAVKLLGDGLSNVTADHASRLPQAAAAIDKAMKRL